MHILMSVWIYGVPTIFTDTGLVRSFINRAFGSNESGAQQAYNVYFKNVQDVFLWLSPDISTRYVTQYVHFLALALLMVGIWLISNILWTPFRLLLENICPKCACCCGAKAEGLLSFSEAIQPGAEKPLTGHPSYSIQDNDEYAEKFAFPSEISERQEWLVRFLEVSSQVVSWCRRFAN